MRFYKVSVAGFIASLTFSVLAQQSNHEKANETLNQTSSQANEMVKKYGQDVQSLVPKSHKENEKGHTTGSFLDKQEKAFGEMQKRLEKDGLLKGVNEDGQAQHIEQRIPDNFMTNQKTKLDAYVNEFNKSGMLEGFDEESIAKKMQKYKDAVQLIADQSNAGMLKSLKEDLGLSFSEQQDPNFDPSALVEPEYLKAIFISFEMRSADIRKIMDVAVEQGAQIFLKGMHEDDLGIQDTIRRLHFIGRDLNVNPDVRFKPRYFDEFNITKAPTILIRNEMGAMFASGITNINWLKNKLEKEGPKGYLGNYGDTVAVTEKDIREEFKERMANMNHEGKVRKVVDGFWGKKQFHSLPPATEDNDWFIDPTVKAKKDIINPRGDQLAYKGQVINPIGQMPVPLTLYVFDPTDNQQLEWVANNHRYGEGQTMLIFSQLDKTKGWKHLEALRTYFGRELYELPKEMIERFQLSHLPVKITTDMQRKLMRVEQFKISDDKEK